MPLRLRCSLVQLEEHLLHAVLDHVLHETLEQTFPYFFLVGDLSEAFQLSCVDLQGDFEDCEPVYVVLEFQVVEVLFPGEELAVDEGLAT